MPEPRDVAPDAETTTARTGPVVDARLDHLLHDLDVANDAHPTRRECTRLPDTTEDHGETLHRDGPATGC